MVEAHTKLLAYPAPPSANVGARNTTQSFGGHRLTSQVALTADKAYQGATANGDLTIQLAQNFTKI